MEDQDGFVFPKYLLINYEMKPLQTLQMCNIKLMNRTLVQDPVLNQKKSLYILSKIICWLTKIDIENQAMGSVYSTFPFVTNTSL